MAKTSFFSDLINRRLKADTVLDVSGGGRVLIISDLHMGGGRRDDLDFNGELLIGLLENYYYPQGWYLVLNGDIEELQRHTLDRVIRKWERLFRIFNMFDKQKRLYKLIGNHDEELLLRKFYLYPLYNMLRIDTGVIPAFIFHGHQPSNIYSNFNRIIGVGIRFVLKPFGIKNISSARSPYRRYHVERAAYQFSLHNNCISIIGHTHRPLFESLGRFDYIKFEIERLCRNYPEATADERQKIEKEVAALRGELGRLGRKERRDVLRQSLYGDELPVPCLFNSGCTIGKKGLHAIEITREDIALVYWYAEGRGRKFIDRGNYEVEKTAGGCRVVLNRDRLDYISARIKLLGS